MAMFEKVILLLMMGLCAFIVIIFGVAIKSDLEKFNEADEAESQMNTEEWCRTYYSDEYIKYTPVKCLEVFFDSPEVIMENDSQK